MIQYIHKNGGKKFTDHHNTSVKNVHTEEGGRSNGTTHLTFNLIQEKKQTKKQTKQRWSNGFRSPKWRLVKVSGSFEKTRHFSLRGGWVTLAPPPLHLSLLIV